MIPGWSPTKVVQTVPVGCLSMSRGKKYVFKMHFSKTLSKTTCPRAFIFSIYHHLEALYQSCSNYAPGVKFDPTPGVQILHWIVKGKLWMTSSSKPLMGIWPNLTGVIPVWSPTKIVQTVPIACISRPWGQKIGSQNAISETTKAIYMKYMYHLVVLHNDG